MGLMDMIGGLFGKKKSGNPLLDALLPMLAGGGALGGLGGLVSKLTNGGLGDQAKSWVGTGPNQAVTPDQVHQALGQDTISQLAQQSGMSHDEVKTGLAGMLPNLVNQLTPNGSIPNAGSIGSMLKGLDLGKLLGH
jgi:uncharacterized protein YidB (DUF937 family)